MVKKKKIIEKKIKTDKRKVGKRKKKVVEPTIDLENLKEGPVDSTEETDLAAELANFKDKYLRLYLSLKTIVEERQKNVLNYY